MKIKKYSLDGLSKLRETLNKLFKKDKLRPQPLLVPLPRKFFPWAS
jgi:hypothetical protein